MGKVSEFLGEQWIDRKITELDEHLLGPKQPMVRRGAVKKANKNASLLLRWVKNMDRACSPEEELASRVSFQIQRAELAFVRGENPESVRSRYHQIAEPWEAVFEKINWKRKPRSITCESRRHAEKYAKDLNGRVTGTGGNLRVIYSELPQPYDSKEIIQCALISGDAKLAKRLAKLYRTQTPAEAGDRGFCVLRELIAERDDLVAQHVKNLPDGYPHDWAPERIELPQGILKNDPRMILRGVKAINTRFKTAWDIKRIRARYDRVFSQFARYKNEKNVPTWDEFMDKARREIVGMKWLLSPWALAFLNIAAMRGMSGLFDNPKDFSEWVPLGFCKPLA